MKICCACGESKELDKFYVNKAMRSGYYSKCKKCTYFKKPCKQGRPLRTIKSPE